MLITIMMMKCKCVRCGNQWIARVPGRPKQCPNCKQTKWDTPSRFKPAQRVSAK